MQQKMLATLCWFCQTPEMLTKISSSSSRRTKPLQPAILAIYDHLYANAPVRTPAGIMTEVGKLLHVGMYMELERGNSPAFSLSRADKRVALGTAASVELSEAMQRAFKQMNGAWRLYAEDEAINLAPFDLAFCALELAGVALVDENRDVFGDALEIVRSQWAKQVGGQFFTDSQITHLAMDLLEFDPFAGDDLVDVCAGTGGFLLAGLNHVVRLAAERRLALSEPQMVATARECLVGQEVDGDVAAVANATLRARIGDTGERPVVMRGDSLGNRSFAGGGPIQFGHHACAASNPPFGVKITIKDPEILRQFELGHSAEQKGALPNFAPAVVVPRPPDVLFIERNLQLLRPGGRLAIVLPYQILSGPQSFYIRDWILRNAIVKAVVDLPNESFQPHTGTKTALLVVARRERPLERVAEAEDDPELFMAMPRHIGHDRRGNPVYVRRPDGTPTSDLLTDFPAVADAFRCYKRGKTMPSDLAFAVAIRDILSDPQLRLNALYHRPAADSPGVADGERWTTVKLRDVVRRIFFPGRFKRNYVPAGDHAIPFLGGSNITELITSDGKWIARNDPHLADLQVQPGWLLVTRSGSTGIVSSVPECWRDYALSEHVIRIVPDCDLLDPDYLHAALRSDFVQDQLARGVFGSVIDEITPDHVGNLSIPVPTDLAELEFVAQAMREAQQHRQRAIAGLDSVTQRLNLSWS